MRPDAGTLAPVLALAGGAMRCAPDPGRTRYYRLLGDLGR